MLILKAPPIDNLILLVKVKIISEPSADSFESCWQSPGLIPKTGEAPGLLIKIDKCPVLMRQ